MAAKTTSKTEKKTSAKPLNKKQNVVKSGLAKGLDLIRQISLRPKNTKIDEFRSGDTVNVYVKVKEGEKERVQLYKGLVTKIQGTGASRAFTVRKISSGVGVERTFPFGSPALDRVEVLTRGHVRRSRLYFLRSLEGKAAKINSDLVGTTSSSAAAVEAADTAAAPAPETT